MQVYLKYLVLIAACCYSPIMMAKSHYYDAVKVSDIKNSDQSLSQILFANFGIGAPDSKHNLYRRTGWVTINEAIYKQFLNTQTGKIEFLIPSEMASQAEDMGYVIERGYEVVFTNIDAMKVQLWEKPNNLSLQRSSVDNVFRAQDRNATWVYFLFTVNAANSSGTTNRVPSIPAPSASGGSRALSPDGFANRQKCPAPPICTLGAAVPSPVNKEQVILKPVHKDQIILTPVYKKVEIVNPYDWQLASVTDLLSRKEDSNDTLKGDYSSSNMSVEVDFRYIWRLAAYTSFAFGPKLSYVKTSVEKSESRSEGFDTALAMVKTEEKFYGMGFSLQWLFANPAPEYYMPWLGAAYLYEQGDSTTTDEDKAEIVAYTMVYDLGIHIPLAPHVALSPSLFYSVQQRTSTAGGLDEKITINDAGLKIAISTFL